MIIDQTARLQQIAAARCVTKQLHPMVVQRQGGQGRAEIRSTLLGNAPLRAFFAPAFTQVVLAGTKWVNADLAEIGHCARNALSLAGVGLLQDVFGKEEVDQDIAQAKEKARPPMTYEQIAFAPGMTAEAAALTFDLLEALGRPPASQPGSWLPPSHDDEAGEALLRGLGIAT